MQCSATSPHSLQFEDHWLTEPVVLLARGIAADVALDRLPILADALEESGCDNSPLLDHLRQEAGHRVECWALRRTLRTTLLLPGGVPITFAYCPAGTFLMGSERAAMVVWGKKEELPVHRVRLTRAFHAGIYPVTQLQWRAVMGTNPSFFKGDDRPVEHVGWEDAQEFCRKAAEATGRAVRLPTEAEWEYACRAGTTTDYHFGDVITDQLANYDATSSWNDSPEGEFRHETTPVGLFPANPWGLFDCHGNVSEWCADWYDAGYYARSPAEDPECRDGERQCRVHRGGSWFRYPIDCRTADRGHSLPDGSSFWHDGLRVVYNSG